MEDRGHTEISNAELKQHPKEKSCLLSHLFFCWQIPLIIKGWRKELTEDDVYKPLKEYESKRLGDKLERLWQYEEDFQKNPSLLRALIKQFGLEFFLYSFLFLPVHLAYFILQPLCLNELLDYYTTNVAKITSHQAIFYASMIIILNVLNSFITNYTTMELNMLGTKVRIACSSLIYRRALKLKQSDLEEVTLGHLINLLSNDVNKFDSSLTFMHFLWISPLDIIVAIYFLDKTFGHVAISGIILIFIITIAQTFTTSQLSEARREVALKTDYRVRLMNDIICGITAIKLYAWENPFTKLISIARKSELNKVKVANILRLMMVSIKPYFTHISLFLPILTTVVTGSRLTSQFVFTSYTIFNNLRMSVGQVAEKAGNAVADTKISIQRIETYLLHDRQRCIVRNKQLNFSASCVPKSKLDYSEKVPGVHLKLVSFKWNKSSKKLVLDHIDIQAGLGYLVGVIGAAGSGKSTLLHTILKEIRPLKGTVDVEGVVSYASQEPWIFSTSVKQNILFGQDFDLQKYLKVIKICALEHDLSLFPHGDQTLVGERGVMLSGGQKARIGLARAVYKDADIYLLDDPLSAVDAHVAQHIFSECISEYLKTKCVILVTHQVQFLQNVTKLYCLEVGRVVESDKNKLNLGKYFTGIHSKEDKSLTTVSLEHHGIQSGIKEHRSTSSSDVKIMKNYLKAADHGSYSCLIILLFVFMQICTNCLDNFLTFWVNLEQKDISLDYHLSTFFTTFNCLYVYTFLLILSMVISHFKAFCFVMFCQNVSKNLHNNMFLKIIYGSMSFFNHHSSGRILNRFTKDMGSIDEVVPLLLVNGLDFFLLTLGITFNIVFANFWLVPAVAVLFIAVACYSIIFQNTKRSLKRTEGTTRSKVFTHVSASVQGLTSIRAFGVQNIIIEEFDRHQDVNSSTVYLFNAIFNALGFWTDMTCIIFTCLVIFGFQLVDYKSSVGYVGLAISNSITLSGIITAGSRSWSELLSQMVSVERVLDYAELDPEQDEGSNTPQEGWPRKGNVSFCSVSLRYAAQTPLVLENVSLKIQAGEKIGIVGRTGAGKTSLVSVLFRLFQFEGVVLVDGVDTKTIPLNTLRSKISIIPQDPVLFLGTLRKNIDPFDEYTDDQIWSCLEETELKEMVSNLPKGLDSTVSAQGSNFSVGQKQLLCLVRAMLRNNRIIVLDEATANVDLQTDELIQSTIRKKFRDSTVLTIAHRLNTVIDSDKILVMKDGQVVEFGPPLELLQDPEGFFYGYIKDNPMIMD